MASKGTKGRNEPPAPHSTNEVAKLREQVDKTKQVMMQNIDLAIDRGAKLDEIQDKSSKLSEAADTFKKQSRQVKRHFCLMYWKYMLMLFVVLLVIALIIYFLVR